MDCLKTSPGLTAWKLAQRANLNPSTVATELPKMIKDGILTRSKSKPGGWEYRLNPESFLPSYTMDEAKEELRLNIDHIVERGF